MTHDELIEAVALALVNRDQERFDLPRIETVADFRCQEDAFEYLANARAAIRVIAPAVLDQALAEVRMREGPVQKHESPVQWQRRLTGEAIRALKQGYE